MPIAAIASVIGRNVAQNGVGDATRSSRIPSRRCRCSAAAAAVVVSDQMPIIADPTAAATSVACFSPPWKRKYAIVA